MDNAIIDFLNKADKIADGKDDNFKNTIEESIKKLSENLEDLVLLSMVSDTVGISFMDMVRLIKDFIGAMAEFTRENESKDTQEEKNEKAFNILNTLERESRKYFKGILK